MRQRDAALVSGNGLRLGLFGANCSSARTYATLPERWQANWENNLRLAQLADEIGIECMVPIARWKGYGGQSNPNGSSFEAMAWAVACWRRPIASTCSARSTSPCIIRSWRPSRWPPRTTLARGASG